MEVITQSTAHVKSGRSGQAGTHIHELKPTEPDCSPDLDKFFPKKWGRGGGSHLIIAELNTHGVQELGKLGSWGKGGCAGLATASWEEVSPLTSVKVWEQNWPCFISALQISQDLSRSSLTRNAFW